MWNFSFVDTLSVGVPLVSFDLSEAFRLLVEFAAWLFIVACFGVGLSCLRGAAFRPRSASSEPLQASPETTKSSDRSDLGAAA
jgi:hypothetical protein